MEKQLSKMKERLWEMDIEAGVILVEQAKLLEEMKPLQAAIQNYQYKMNNLNMSKSELLREYIQFLDVKEALEDKQNDEERGIYA